MIQRNPNKRTLSRNTVLARPNDGLPPRASKPSMVLPPRKRGQQQPVQQYEEYPQPAQQQVYVDEYGNPVYY